MAEIVRSITIVNDLGLHARAASKLVQLASRFACSIQIGRDDMMVNSKSIMGVLMLAAAKGTELSLIAAGNDAVVCTEALDAIEKLVADRFGEDS